MESLPTVSVVIPTHNRKDLLRETLDALAQQTYPKDYFEVIVADDSSTDGTESIVAEPFPFRLHYFRHSSKSATEARNLGARQSRADILVFLDDDILVEPNYLAYLVREHATSQTRIVVGKVSIQCEETTPLSETLNAMLAPSQNSEELAFIDVYSNNMSLRREEYFKLGMMQDLGFMGSGSWCDVDLAYRAYSRGFDFRRSPRAKCWHRDYFATNFGRHKERVRTSAYQAVVLFRKYPELLTHLPMFYDKSPIVWDKDPPRLIVRKLIRSIGSSRLVLWSMEQMVTFLERYLPASFALPALYRYIIGGQIFRGYREGLNRFGRVDNADRPILAA